MIVTRNVAHLSTVDAPANDETVMATAEDLCSLAAAMSDGQRSDAFVVTLNDARSDENEEDEDDDLVLESRGLALVHYDRDR